jgi:hypothetical protein
VLEGLRADLPSAATTARGARRERTKNIFFTKTPFYKWNVFTLFIPPSTDLKVKKHS